MTWRERLWTAWSVLRGRITLREHVTSVAVDAADDGRTFSTGFVQWKGTTVCMDATCPVCGHDGHIDADFAYFLKCGACGALCEVGTYVPIFAIAPDDPLYGTALDFMRTRSDGLTMRVDDDGEPVTILARPQGKD